MSLALNEEALTLLFVGRLLVAVDGVVVCCVLFGFIEGKGFIALDFLAFFLLVFLFAIFVPYSYQGQLTGSASSLPQVSLGLFISFIIIILS